MMTSRAKTEIVYDILNTIQKIESGEKPTHVVFKANLSRKLLDKYLTVMLADDLVRIVFVNNKTRYKITKKGIIFLKILLRLEKMTHLFKYTEI